MLRAGESRLCKAETPPPESDYAVSIPSYLNTQVTLPQCQCFTYRAARRSTELEGGNRAAKGRQVQLAVPFG